MKELVVIKINGIPITTELDSGAPVILMPYNVYRQHFEGIPLQHYQRGLTAAGEFPLDLVAAFDAVINLGQRQGRVRVVVK